MPDAIELTTKLIELNRQANDLISEIKGPVAEIYKVIFSLTDVALDATRELRFAEIERKHRISPLIAGHYEGTGYSPILDAMHDYRPFSWLTGGVLQYGPIGRASPNMREARRATFNLNC